MNVHSLQEYERNFKEVYLNYFSRMTRFAQQFVIEKEEAENIVHDIFIEIWEKKWDLPSITNLNGYLFSVLRNRCIDFLRSTHLERRIKLDIQEEHAREFQLKLQSLEAMDNVFLTHPNRDQLVNEAIAKLPEKCRQIFVMNKFENKRQKEIAQDLGISIHTVESQMAIAYKKLEESLKRYFPLLLLFFY